MFRPSVHPRVCGELAYLRAEAERLGGSSPRVRGTPPRRRHDPRGGRFIPACAGNSQRGHSRRSPVTVHPRVCGELRQPIAQLLAQFGSSPRVRGTRRHLLLCPVAGRFIPACAGNSRVRGARLSAGFGSSPRVRGTLVREPCEELVGRFIPACAGNSVAAPSTMGVRSGSSPRVRGTPGRRWRCSRPRRFIPACAGNSRPPRREVDPTPVHPRVCGELCLEARRRLLRSGSSPRVRGTLVAETAQINAAAVHPRVCGELEKSCALWARMTGSSPRVRGTPRGGVGPRQARRFIPACAGNSESEPGRSAVAPVHPRVCGELPAPDRRRDPAGRFIPACAGNSRPGWRDGPASSVHPRVCGELGAGFVGCGLPAGSSPRVRGTRCAVDRERSGGRFIPACAGNSSRMRPTHCGRPVHPRVCGELWLDARAGAESAGSSPRVRGTHFS